MRLEPAEFTLLWSRLALPPTPLELDVPAQGATLAEAAHLTAAAESTLHTRDLLIGDEPAPKVAGLLCAIAHRTAQVDLRWATPGAPELRALVAFRGKHNVLATWDGAKITLEWVPRETFAEELTAKLGESSPGTGRSTNVPAETLKNAAHENPDKFQTRLTKSGIPRDDARALRDFATAERYKAGQIGASATDRWGVLHRAAWVIHILDTDKGRYATYERRGYRTVVGVTNARLATIINDLHRETTQKRWN